MKNKLVRNIIITAILLIIAGVTFYQIIYLGVINKRANPNSEISKLLSMNIEDEYPQSARDVVKLYNRMIRALYDNKWKDVDLADLTVQMKVLFDNELAGNNPDEQFFNQTKEDMESYRKAKRTIVGAIVEREQDIVYSQTDGTEYASLNVSYTMRVKKSYSKTYNQFILRKDNEDKWKILGWKSIDEVQINGD